MFGAQVLRVGTWRTVFWVLTGIGVVLVVLTAAVVKESLPGHRRARTGPVGTFAVFGRLLRDRVYLGYAVAGCAVCAAMFGYISASPFLLQDGFGLSPQMFSACFAVNALGIVAMSNLGRILLRRTTSLVLLRWGVWQCAVGAALLAVVLLAGLGLPFVLVGLFVLVSSVGFALTYASVLAMDLHRGVAGSASALLGAAQYALGAVTARLVGFGNKTAGTALAFTVLGAAVIAIGGLWMAVRPAPGQAGMAAAATN